MTKEIEFRISVTGDLGSGKSTVCEILAKKMNAERVTLGAINRKMAMEMNMDAVEFNKFIVGKPEYDKIFDDYQRAYENKPGSYIIDSRLGFHFVPSTYSFYLKTDIEGALSVGMGVIKCDLYNLDLEVHEYPVIKKISDLKEML